MNVQYVCQPVGHPSPAGTTESSPCMTASSPVKCVFLFGDKGSPLCSEPRHGRRFLAFILTLDAVPNTQTIELGRRFRRFF